MHTIPVSLEVLKVLTNRLESEGQTFDDLLREILEIDSPIEPEGAIEGPLNKLIEGLEPWARGSARLRYGEGFYSRGLFLPNGTELRARYKGKLYFAKIEDEQWFDEKGQEHTSPSAAASAITGTNVNGLRFWEAQFPDWPNKMAWRRLDKLR